MHVIKNFVENSEKLNFAWRSFFFQKLLPRTNTSGPETDGVGPGVGTRGGERGEARGASTKSQIGSCVGAVGVGTTGEVAVVDVWGWG
jgi:hypothetical protein